MVKKLLVLLCSLLVLTPLVVLGVGKARLAQAQTKRSAPLSEAEVQALIAALERARETLPFWEIEGGCDAGEVLNPGISMSGQWQSEAPPWWDSVDTRGTDWLEHPETIPGPDFSVFERIGPCGHWDMQSSGVYADYLASPEAVLLRDAPAPNLVSLQWLAKARLSAGLRGDVDILLALQDVRHLAQLTFWGEQRLATGVAFSLLTLERRAYDKAASQGLLVESDWRPVGEADASSAHRALYGLTAVYTGRAPHGALERVQTLSAPMGECAALKEGVAELLGRERLYGFDAPWPGEQDLRGHHAQVREALESSSCGLALARQTLAQPNWVSNMDPMGVEQPMPTRLPYFRQVARLQGEVRREWVDFAEMWRGQGS